MHRNRLFPYFALFGICILTSAVYAPGLHGGFLFDDFANLPVLGATGPVDNWPAFWRYVTSGNADPTGRPIALLSFLIDAHDWPAAPEPFLRTNILLHLLNGVLLAMLLRRLGRAALLEQSQADLAAALAAGLWMLHPLFVSTTLYIVQREAMLSTLFTLIGLVLWLKGRNLICQGRPTKGYGWVALGLGGCTALALLSKANGILLPALALLIEYAFLGLFTAKTDARPRLYRLMIFVLAVIPTLSLLSYLSYEGWRGITHGISAVRPWTLEQRLLTEPRVLMNYLALLWIPTPFTAGLFNDQIHASTSLLLPLTTLFSVLGLVALIFGALLLRRRHPALALAILFYLVGQSLESSTVALELYFEHRNYLPAMLMFWPLALWLCGARSVHAEPVQARNAGVTSPSNSNQMAKLAFAALLVLGLASMTYAGADLWGNPKDQALLWAKLNPNSPRAQASAAQAEMSAGRPDLAVKRLSSALLKQPNEVQLSLNLLAAQCLTGGNAESSLVAAEQSLARTRDTGTLLANWFGRIIAQSERPPCPQMHISNVERLLQAAMDNPFLNDQPGRRQDLYSLAGQIALARKMPDIALADFNQALDQQVRATAAFQQAALLGSSGYPIYGLAHLTHYQGERDREYQPAFGMPAIHQWVLRRQHYWDNELARLQATLREDASRQTSTNP